MAVPPPVPPDAPAAEPPPTPPAIPADDPAAEKAAADKAIAADKKHRKWRFRRRVVGGFFLLLLAALVVGRIYLGSWVTWYVNRVIDQNKLYDGKVGTVDIHLYKGNYSIHDIKLLKVTGNVAEPFFECERLDISVDWHALFKGRVKANVNVERPHINFVAGPTDSQSQTGATAGGGPWLKILRDLAPFDINSANVHQGEVHFQNHYRTPQVDLALTQLDAEVKNLTNIDDHTNRLNATVDVTGRAMDSGHLECHVKFDPFSYKPTFQLALRLLRLDVSKLNNFTKAYGDFDFENGYFDFVTEINSREGLLDGYVKPLFRDVQIFSVKDLQQENILNAFWQALLGTAEFVLRNQPRGQFGTQIPVTGMLDAPKPDLLTTIGNVLRNAFIRAYLPRLEGATPDVDGLEFKAGEIAQPGSASTN